MDRRTHQTEEWSGDFGRDYTDRNLLPLDEMDQLYERRYGLTRTAMNSRFVGDLDRDIRILEVGSNIGNQLLCLQRAGFRRLYGIELQSYAVELSKARTKDISIIAGTAFDIPFKDDFFDLVFTSGVLIHIAPGDITPVLDEIYRCTSRYIWGFEYYAEAYTEVNYRGHTGLLWKTDFPRLYLERFPDLRLVKVEHFKWLDTSNNIDSMFLLQRKNTGRRHK